VAVLLRRNVVTGATLAFRAGFRPWVLPVGPGWIHDGWIALVIAALADLAPIPLPLVRYRQHAAQQVGPAASGWRGQLRDRRAVLARVRAKAEHHRARARIRRSSLARGPLVLHELASGRYQRYAGGWRSAARDLLL
jgi:hypothetical protein